MKRWVSHALGVSVLCLAGLLAHGRALTMPSALGDEIAYVCAAEAAAAGQSPYAECPRYLYPPALARGAGLVVELGGRRMLLVVLRTLIGLGAVATVWLSLLLTRWSFRTRVWVGALLMALAPPVTQSLEVGNLSAVVAALSISALFALEHSAVLAASLLACAILLKPLPAVVPLLLGVQGLVCWRKTRGSPPRSLVAGTLTVLACAALFAMTGGLGTPQPYADNAPNNISVLRLLRDVGWVASPRLLFGVALVGGAALAAWRARQPRFVAGLALVTCLLSAPVVWNHSWLMILPVLTVAADRAVAGYRRAPTRSAERSRALLEVVLVGLGAAVLATSDALGAVFFGLPRYNALVVSIPLVTPSLLLAYATKRA